jgi:hypothetical protein
MVELADGDLPLDSAVRVLNLAEHDRDRCAGLDEPPAPFEIAVGESASPSG